jgi:hypothetical protein
MRPRWRPLGTFIWTVVPELSQSSRVADHGGVTDGGEGEVIRRYSVADQPAVDALLDARSDRLWVAQGHRLHGEARDGARWRRTLVAETSGRIVGAVTVARNRVHPGRYNLAVEVGAGSRRGGVGRRLIEHARRLTPEPLPFGAKLRPTDAAGMALLRRVGGRVYQRCPGLCPDPCTAEVLGWAAAANSTSGGEVRSLACLPRDDWAELWVRQYLWVHREWSPAAEEPLREVAQDLIGEVDPELTSITVRDDRVNAVSWVFDGNDSTAEVVAETIQKQTSEGVADLAASLARSLAKLAERHVRKAEIDGHISDPHLQPVIETFPPVPREPLDLVEVDPAATTPGAAHRRDADDSA